MSQKIEVFDEALQEPIWYNCAAQNKCEGTFAVLCMKVETQGVGVTYRYRCLTCNQPFSVQMGHGFK